MNYSTFSNILPVSAGLAGYERIELMCMDEGFLTAIVLMNPLKRNEGVNRVHNILRSRSKLIVVVQLGVIVQL